MTDVVWNRCFDKEDTTRMEVSKTGVTENAEDASSDSEVAQFYRPGLCCIVIVDAINLVLHSP